MSTKKSVVEKVVEVKKESVLKFVVTFPDGTISEGTTTLRKFNPNIKNGVVNSGFQVKIASGSYSGSLMIIDYLMQEKI